MWSNRQLQHTARPAIYKPGASTPAPPSPTYTPTIASGTLRCKMASIHPWLISGTATMLQRPKLYIVVPILAMFLVAYNAVYDLTLRPLNGHFMAHYNNSTLSDGETLHYSASLALFSVPGCARDVPHVTKLTLEGDNVLRYDYLTSLAEYQHLLEQEEGVQVVLSPLTLWQLPLQERLPADMDKIERYVLKLLNTNHDTELIRFFFDGMGKLNHMLTLAQEVHVYVLSCGQFLPPAPQPPITLAALLVISGSSAHADIQHYTSYILGNSHGINFFLNGLRLVQVVSLAGILLHIYLAICNQHKIRSNIGLMIGWVTEVSIAALAAACLSTLSSTSQSWNAVLGPFSYVAPGSYIMLIMVLSSRNLYRTVHDLAGDNTFGAPENLHKRLIKYYLGINSSVQNSQGVFALTRLFRKLLFIDKLAVWILPIPNTTVILLINMGGLTICTSVLAVAMSPLIPASHWELFYQSLIKSYKVIILALVIDHLLQLTFLVGIIVIDLNRIDLTDMLNRKLLELNSNYDNYHEANSISAKLLGLDGTKSSTVVPNSWRYRLGTHFLKAAPISLKSYWLFAVPSIALWTMMVTLVSGLLIIPIGLSTGNIDLYKIQRLSSQKNDSIYYFELFAILIFIIAISELTFTLTYSKRQRKQHDLDLKSTLVPLTTNLSVTELLKTDEEKFFECITLPGRSSSDITKLYSNSKCSFLITTNMDHEVFVWSPLSKVEKNKPLLISTHFESLDPDAKKTEFWPINHIEVSDNGDFVVLINYNHCRLKCFDRRTLKYEWEISLTSELNKHGKRMRLVNSFFRIKTVTGFLARKMLLKQNQLKRRGSSTLVISASTISGNYQPPSSIDDEYKDIYDKSLHRDEFVMVLETGEMITIACDTVQTKVYNIVAQVYEGTSAVTGLKIVSLQLLTTARVNDKVICNMSNDDIVVGTAVNNIWRFNKLDLESYFTTKPLTTFAPPLMSRTGSAVRVDHDFTTAYEMQRQNFQSRPVERDLSVFTQIKKFPPINKSTIITIDFVGMFIRVKNLQAELVDMQTGTILKVFHIGHFKPGTFKVTHSEPTHCKFCGCASVESLTLIYEDFYERTVILHTYTIEIKKSRNNICLRVERDSREIRCLGFDSVVERQFWYEDIEKWEVTDMNVIIGIKKITQEEEPIEETQAGSIGFERLSEDKGLTSLKQRGANKNRLAAKNNEAKLAKLAEVWQGFVVTALNGKLLEYNIPSEAEHEKQFACMRPNFILKYGYKSVAIAFGNVVKILFLGGDKLIENDLYYSGTTSTLTPLLKPSSDGMAKTSELLFISKRRKMQERRLKASVLATVDSATSEEEFVDRGSL